ncbi:MAG: amidohydrolase family protein, partial [Candidatus Hodarchaeota archaeon]
GDQWKFTSRGKSYEFKIVPNPPVYEIFKQAAATSEQYTKMMEKLENSWLFDFGVGFPFQDKYRANDPTALYRASNERVSSVVTKFPVSLKMIGYCRVHPDEGQKAVDEIAHAITNLGLRGLKLHPRSEQWLDHVNSANALNCLVQAAKLSLPVIFDTRGKQSIYDIHDLVKSTRAYIERNSPQLLPHLKVLVGHCAAGNMQDRGTYDAISDPNIFGELSMIRSPEFDSFIVDFMNSSPAGKDWSKHIIFGSDFPYFFERHAKDIISFLISKRFFDAGATIEDLKNIIGMNQLRILPDYNVPPKQASEIPNPVSIHAKAFDGTKPLELISQIIVKLIEDRSVEITKVEPMFRDSFKNYDNEYLLGTKWKENGNQEKDVLFLVMNLIKDELFGLGPISPEGVWNKFGYAFFDPSGFNALNSLANINIMEDPDEAWKELKKLFTVVEEKKKLKPLPRARRPMKPMKGAGGRPSKPIKPR